MKNNDPGGASPQRPIVHGFVAAAAAVIAGVSLSVAGAWADEAEPAQVAANGPARAETFSCRYEKPTGSRRAIKVCRAQSSVEDDGEISRKSMGRAQHYGNPALSPRD